MVGKRNPAANIRRLRAVRVKFIQGSPSGKRMPANQLDRTLPHGFAPLVCRENTL